MGLRTRPVGPAAITWVRALRRMGFSYMMFPHRPDEMDKAFSGARWIEAQRWITRVTEEAACEVPSVRRDVIDSIAAAAYGYSVDPDYPGNDRDEIFWQMMWSYEGSTDEPEAIR